MPDQAATAALTANSSVTANATAAYVAATAILALASTSDHATGHYAGYTTISGLGSVTATAQEGGETAVCHISANSAFGVGLPTVRTSFRPIPPPVVIPTIRVLPQPAPTSTYTIQPAKPPTQPGGTTTVNVKR